MIACRSFNACNHQRFKIILVPRTLILLKKTTKKQNIYQKTKRFTANISLLRSKLIYRTPNSFQHQYIYYFTFQWQKKKINFFLFTVSRLQCEMGSNKCLTCILIAQKYSIKAKRRKKKTYIEKRSRKRFSLVLFKQPKRDARLRKSTAREHIKRCVNAHKWRTTQR